MLKMNPYLSFAGDGKEAMTFYHECLGGNLEIQMVKDSPAASQVSAAFQDRMMHGNLTVGDIVIMASDTMRESDVVDHNGSIAIAFTGPSLDEMQAIFDKLSVGAQEVNPLKEEFFGTFGDITDKYGVHWLFNVDPANN